MLKCVLTKTFECSGLCLICFLCVVCKCSKNQINPPTLIILLLDPKPFLNDHAMCIGHNSIFLQKYFGQKVFSKLGFPKTPQLRFALQVLDLGYEKAFKEYV